MRSLPHPRLLAIALVLAGCGRKPEVADDGTGVVAALDRTTADAAPVTAPPPGPRLPIDGVDLSELDADQRARFEALADSLASPCGAAESLRKSATSGACPRAPFAARYLALLLDLGAEDDQVRDHYENRYTAHPPVRLVTGGEVPHAGPTGAPVKFVEFYDYGCPICAKTAYPAIEKMLAAHPDDVVVYYKQYPIVDKHPNSGACAQAALAAQRQGKFLAMHRALFDGWGKQTPDDIRGYARAIGLDMDRFERDFTAAAAQVVADRGEGHTAGVHATPTMFIDGRLYGDPVNADLLDNWIAEELALRPAPR